MTLLMSSRPTATHSILSATLNAGQCLPGQYMTSIKSRTNPLLKILSYRLPIIPAVNSAKAICAILCLIFPRRKIATTTNNAIIEIAINAEVRPVAILKAAPEFSLITSVMKPSITENSLEGLVFSQPNTTCLLHRSSATPTAASGQKTRCAFGSGSRYLEKSRRCPG